MEQPPRSPSGLLVSYASLALIACVMAGITYALYLHTERLLQDRLKERLRTVATAAALAFDPADLERIHTGQDVGSEPFVRVTQKLQDVRRVSGDIFYAYLLRPTSTPGVFAYIADADSMDPSAEIDLNGDGQVDESDALNTPGDLYDAADVPALRDEAATRPTTDAAPLAADAYGTFLSAYAPIRQGGRTVGILCLDVEVSDYLRLIRATFVPFLGFVLFLFGLLALLTYQLVRVWSRQVRLVAEIDRQKDELLGIVAHQLRNPITATKWSMEGLLDGDFGALPGEAKQQLAEIKGRTDGLFELVELLVDVSKIELGRLSMDRRETDLGPFFEEILRTIWPQAESKGVELRPAVAKDLGRGVLDPRLTRMAVENLLSNAVKYTPAGGLVRLEVGRRDNVLHVTVADSGVGIPKADQPQIFGKLYRASNVRAMQGNGFGLYVAKGAVEQQGGRIRFESAERHGTTFIVEVPLAA